MSRKISLHSDTDTNIGAMRIEGFYDGPRTYLTFRSESGSWLGSLSRKRLKTLAERVLRQFAEGKR